MEAAAGGRVRAGADFSGQKRFLFPLFGICNRHCIDQGAGVRVYRMMEHLLRRPDLHNFTKLHDCDPVADIIDRAESMSNEHARQPEVLLQAAQQIQNLCLNRNVQRADRLITDQKPGI